MGNDENPCRNGLSSACFAEYPEFAHRAFSYRLMQLFIPPNLSRKLLTFLGLLILDPETFDPILETNGDPAIDANGQPPSDDEPTTSEPVESEHTHLPPGTVIIPDALIPPDWKTGDPMPEDTIPPDYYPDDGFDVPAPDEPTDVDPVEPTDDDPTDPTDGEPGDPTDDDPPYVPPEPYFEPFPPGPPTPPDPHEPDHTVIWFHDPFTSYDLTYWEEYLDGGALISGGSGQVGFLSYSGDYCILRSINEDDTVPDEFTLIIDLKVYNDASAINQFYINFRTGSHALKLILQPPGHIIFAGLSGAGGTELDIDVFTGERIIWKIVCVDGVCDLYRDDDLLVTGQHMQHDSGGPGKFAFSCEDALSAILYDVKVTTTEEF